MISSIPSFKVPLKDLFVFSRESTASTLKISFTIARYLKTYVLGENRKRKKKIKNATNHIKSRKNGKIIKYLNIQLYFLQRNTQQLIVNKWIVKPFIR